MAEGLRIECGNGTSLDMSEFVTMVEGVERTIAVTDYSETDRSFTLRISPAAGLSEARATLVASLQTDIACMQLDAHPVPLKTPVLAGNSWQVASGCEGHWVRMKDKC